MDTYMVNDGVFFSQQRWFLRVFSRAVFEPNLNITTGGFTWYLICPCFAGCLRLFINLFSIHDQSPHADQVNLC